MTPAERKHFKATCRAVIKALEPSRKAYERSRARPTYARGEPALRGYKGTRAGRPASFARPSRGALQPSGAVPAFGRRWPHPFIPDPELDALWARHYGKAS